MAENNAYKLHFYPCPTKHHKGDTWQCVESHNTTEFAYISEIAFVWSDEIPLELIQLMTFDDYTEDDWNEYIKKSYGGRIFGFILKLEHPDGEIITFRPYSVRTHRYYEYAETNEKPYRFVIKYTKNSKST